MISFRILRFRHELLSLFNQDAVQLAEQSQYLDTYTSVIAILIESALPFSVIGLTTCVLVGKGNEIASAFLIIWGTVAVSVLVLWLIHGVHGS